MASPSEMIGWECGACTYTNDDCTRRDCPMCTMERPKRCFVVPGAGVSATARTMTVDRREQARLAAARARTPTTIARAATVRCARRSAPSATSSCLVPVCQRPPGRRPSIVASRRISPPCATRYRTPPLQWTRSPLPRGSLWCLCRGQLPPCPVVELCSNVWWGLSLTSSGRRRTTGAALVPTTPAANRRWWRDPRWHFVVSSWSFATSERRTSSPCTSFRTA